MAEIKWSNVDGSALNSAVSNAQSASDSFVRNLRGLGHDVVDFTDKLQQRADEAAEWQRNQNTQQIINQMHDADSLDALNKLQAKGVGNAQNALNQYNGQVDLATLNKAKATWTADTFNRAESKNSLLDYTPEAQDAIAKARGLMIQGDMQGAAQLINSSPLSNVAKSNAWDLAYKSMIENMSTTAKINENALKLNEQYSNAQQALSDWASKNGRDVSQLIADMNAGNAVPEEFKRLYGNYQNAYNQTQLYQGANSDLYKFTSGGHKLNITPSTNSFGEKINQAEAKQVEESNNKSSGSTKNQNENSSSNNDVELEEAKLKDAKEAQQLIQNNPELKSMQDNIASKERELALASQYPNNPQLPQIEKDLQIQRQSLSNAISLVKNGESNANNLKQSRFDSDTNQIINPNKNPYTSNFIKANIKDGKYSRDTIDNLKNIIKTDYGQARVIVQEMFGLNPKDAEGFMSNLANADSGQIASTINKLNDSIHNSNRDVNQISLSKEIFNNPAFKNFDNNAKDTFLTSVSDSVDGYKSKIIKDSPTIFGNGETNLNAQTIIDKLKSTYSGLNEGFFDNKIIKNYIENAVDKGLPAAYIASAIENTVIDAAKRQGKKVEDGENLAGTFAFGSKNFDKNDFDKLGSLLSGDIASQVKDAQRYVSQHQENQKTLSANGGIGPMAFVRGVNNGDIVFNKDGTISFQSSTEDILGRAYGNRFSSQDKKDSMRELKKLKKSIVESTVDFSKKMANLDEQIKQGEDSEVIATERAKAQTQNDKQLAKEYASYKAAYDQMKVLYSQLDGKNKTEAKKLLAEAKEKIDRIEKYRKIYNL